MNRKSIYACMGINQRLPRPAEVLASGARMPGGMRMAGLALGPRDMT